MTNYFTYLVLIFIISVIVILVDNAYMDFAKSEVFVINWNRAK